MEPYRVTAFLDAINRKDPDATIAFFDKNAELHFPGRPVTRGAAHIRDLLQDIFQLFPAAKFELRKVITQGNLIAAEWKGIGYREGATGAAFFEMGRGGIQRLAVYTDTASIVAARERGPVERDSS